MVDYRTILFPVPGPGGPTETGKVLTAMGDDTAAWMPASGGGGSSGADCIAWVDYTPTLTQGVAVGKTVTYARYVQSGTLVIAQIQLAVTGTGTPGSEIHIGLPVAPAGPPLLPVGHGAISDDSDAVLYNGVAWLGAGSYVSLIGPALTSIPVGHFGQATFIDALTSPDAVTIEVAYEATVSANCGGTPAESDLPGTADQYGYRTLDGCSTLPLKEFDPNFDLALYSGDLNLVFFRAPRSFTSASATMLCDAASPPLSVTLARFGLWALDGSQNLTSLVASTANNTALFASAGLATQAWQAPVSLTQGDWYAFGVLLVGTAYPVSLGFLQGQIFGELSVHALWARPPYIAAQVLGQSDLPATVATGSFVYPSSDRTNANRPDFRLWAELNT